MIDKRSPLPIYYQIEEDIKQKIETGLYAEGEAIPSERELSEQYEVSRMTVRQAVNNLVQDGRLYREKGKGTFVAEEKIEQKLSGMTSFTEDMSRRGMAASSQLLDFSVIHAPKDVMEKLNLEAGAFVYDIHRIRLADEQPMAYERTYIPLELFPELTKTAVEGSLYHYIEQQQPHKIHKASQVIEATIADEEQVDMLGIPPSSAVLYMERISQLADGTPFEVVKSSYRADRYKFISDIYRT
ncbi:GntR family transcriptional regulator [Halobacillus litoralis]|uniref:GntR family transcriptional regulator n=1 Tax=Halobacillus litoralis TaxID=45668 RepID=UPI001CFDD375|nr:GntR family transcriptional regulator [Halobacillus litoralis]